MNKRVSGADLEGFRGALVEVGIRSPFLARRFPVSVIAAIPASPAFLGERMS
jgi:hypothetical protein